MARTKKELDKLRDSYKADVYDPYAKKAEADGQEPQSFDEAFENHLAELDKAEAEAAGTKTDDGNKGDKPKAAAKPKAAPKPKGPVGFRATGDQRKVLNAAAQLVLEQHNKGIKEDKDKLSGKPRLLPRQSLKAQKGFTYTDFLQGKLLKTTDGNGSIELDVVMGRDNTVIGKIAIDVKGGAVYKGRPGFVYTQGNQHEHWYHRRRASWAHCRKHSRSQTQRHDL